MRGGQILELVHQQHAAHPAGRGPGSRVGEKDVDGPHDLVVEIDHAPLVESMGVSGGQVDEAIHVGGVVALHVGWIAQPQARRAERFQPRGQMVGHSPATAAGRPLPHQAVQKVAHLSFVDHFDPAAAGRAGERPGPVAHCQRQAVERAHLQAGQVGSALLHLGPGPDVVGHQAHRGGGHAQVADQPAGPLGEHSGLAGPGRGDDAGASAEMTHRPALVRREVGVGLAVAQAFQAARGEAGGRDQRRASQRCRVERVQRPAVAPCRDAVRCHDLARAVISRLAERRGQGPVAGREVQPTWVAGGPRRWR